MPVTMSSSETCPSTCPLAESKQCYAKLGPMSWTWARLDRQAIGVTWGELIKKISELPKGILWRHNQAGDLPNARNSNLTISPIRKYLLINE